MDDMKYEINVRKFIVDNYTPYYGDASFLETPTEATLKLWDELCEKMYHWLTSDKDRRQLITAIYLYVYTKRKTSGGNLLNE